MPHNKTNPNTNTLILVSLIPNPTHEMRAALAFTRKQKTVTSLVLTSTHTVTKQILYSP